MHKDEKELARIIGASAAKSVMWISIAVALCYWLSSCNVDKETIEACEISCRSAGTHMQTATSTKCECAPSTENSQDIWVTPRTTTNGK